MKEVTVSKLHIPRISAPQTGVRLECARLWNRMVRLHRWFRVRHKPWPSEAQFKAHFKGRFSLHSQTIQALIEQFFSNIDTTRTNRKNGDKRARYPWRTKRFMVVIWKSSAIRRKGRWLMLSQGAGRKPLRLRLPANIPGGKIVEAELGFHELRLAIKREVSVAAPGDRIAALDPGVIHLGVVTDGKESLAVVGRGLRSIIQGHNKAKAEIFALLARCKKGSRRYRKLRKCLALLARERDARQSNLLHHTANAVVDFCVEKKAGILVVGDITEINRGKKKKMSRRTNQENGNNPLGQLYRHLGYKLKRHGIELEKINEAYTSKTCPACGEKHTPAGRRYKCTHCGFVGVRDEVGGMNILNKYTHDGKIEPGAFVPEGKVKYLRPVKLRSVVVPLTRGKLPAITPSSAPPIAVETHVSRVLEKVA